MGNVLSPMLEALELITRNICGSCLEINHVSLLTLTTNQLQVNRVISSPVLARRLASIYPFLQSRPPFPVNYYWANRPGDFSSFSSRRGAQTRFLHVYRFYLIRETGEKLAWT